MRRDLWMILILGCLLILLLEAPAAFSTVTADLEGPYANRARGGSWEPARQTDELRAAKYDPSSTRARNPAPASKQE